MGLNIAQILDIESGHDANIVVTRGTGETRVVLLAKSWHHSFSGGAHDDRSTL